MILILLLLLELPFEISSQRNLIITGIGGNIPDNDLNGFSSSYTETTSNFIIDDISLTLLGLSHDYSVQLQLFLSLDGQSTGSIINTGGSARLNGNYRWKDGASNIMNSPAGADFPPGEWRPASDLLPVFKGRPAAGYWVVKVVDRASGNLGTFSSWRVELLEKACTSPCLTCTSTPIDCTKCSANNYLLTNADGSTKTCVSDTSVLSWSDSGVTRYYFVQGSSDGSGVAAKCTSPCVKCSTAATDCLLCETGSYLLNKADSTKTCISSTDPSSLNTGGDGIQRGFFFDGNNGGSGIASKCTSPCVKCLNSATNCVSCENNNYILTRSDGTKTCVPDPTVVTWSDAGTNRYYFAVAPADGTGTAEKCTSPCVKCSASATNCLLCQTGDYLLTKTDNTVTCISSTDPSNLNIGSDGKQRGFYFTGDPDGTGIANKCSAPCKTCRAGVFCVTCFPNELLFCSTSKGCSNYDQCVLAKYLNEPDDSVPKRSFYTSDDQSSIAAGEAIANMCGPKCRTCISETVCSSCPNMRPIFYK